MKLLYFMLFFCFIIYECIYQNRHLIYQERQFINFHNNPGVIGPVEGYQAQYARIFGSPWFLVTLVEVARPRPTSLHRNPSSLRLPLPFPVVPRLVPLPVGGAGKPCRSPSIPVIRRRGRAAPPALASRKHGIRLRFGSRGRAVPASPPSLASRKI